MLRPRESPSAPAQRGKSFNDRLLFLGNETVAGNIARIFIQGIKDHEDYATKPTSNHRRLGIGVGIAPEPHRSHAQSTKSASNTLEKNKSGRMRRASRGSGVRLWWNGREIDSTRP